MYGLKNAKIYTGQGLVEGKVVLIEGNKIKDILDEAPENIEIIDLEGKIIAPGFIDLQLNGCGGVNFNDEISIETFKLMNETNLKTGTTSYLPTLITTSDANIEKALELVDKSEGLENVGVLGLHIEGPYISIPKRNT